MINSNKFTLGLIINPISGMGGSVGLKGTDGKETLLNALKLGAKPNAFDRARELLSELESLKSRIKFVTCPNFMGEFVLNKFNFEFETINDPIFNDIYDIHSTNAEHTKKSALIMKSIESLKIILFVGGDGTARDIVDAINEDKPCLGIPAGVKIYSSVFSLNPRIASALIIQFLWGEVPLREGDVLDIDEEEFRKGRLVSKLYGHLIIPYNPEYTQFSKIGTPLSDFENQERIANRIIELLEMNIYYLLGPGTTTKAIADALNQKKSVLGVDLLFNKNIVELDLNEEQILKQIKGKSAKIIVSLIGNQGFLFGRGNLQFTPTILKQIGPKNIIIISTKYKIENILNQKLRLDTRSTELDKEMAGLYKIVTDYDETKICKVE